MGADETATPIDKLIAVDLDGTLVGPGNTVSCENLAAIGEATRQGAAVVVVTGRPYVSADALARKLRLPQVPLVTFNGALIREPSRGSILLERPVPAALAAEVVEACQAQRLHLHYYLEDTLYVTRHNAWSRMYCERTEMQCREVPDMGVFAGSEPYKLLVIDRPEAIPPLLEQYRQRWQGRLYVTRSQREYLEFLAPEASKGRALDWLIDFYGVRRDRTLAVGDALNDVPLLERAGYAAAMPDSDPELMDLAQFAPPEPLTGVATAIDWFLTDVGLPES